MNETETAWVAGILEGEGSFILRDGHRPVVQLAMTDEDVVRRVHAFAECGVVNGPYEYNGHKPQWKFQITTSEDAVAFMKEILPWMGRRRMQKIEYILQIWYEWDSVGRDAEVRSRRVVDDETRTLIRSMYSTKRGVLTEMSRRFGVSRRTIKKIVLEEA